MTRVLVFGDSIAYGSWDTQGGWVDRIKKRAHAQTVQSQGSDKLQVINMGIGGDSSSKILKRMTAEIMARYSKSWPFVFVFAFGTNDERTTNGVVETTLQEFEENVRAIIHVAKQHSDKILFVGISPLEESTVAFKEQAYSDERVQEYDRAMQKVIEDEGVAFVPTRPVFERAGLSTLFSYDHLHPNDEGHQLIAEVVEPELRKLIA